MPPSTLLFAYNAYVVLYTITLCYATGILFSLATRVFISVHNAYCSTRFLVVTNQSTYVQFSNRITSKSISTIDRLLWFFSLSIFFSCIRACCPKKIFKPKTHLNYNIVRMRISLWRNSLLKKQKHKQNRINLQVVFKMMFIIVYNI